MKKYIFGLIIFSLSLQAKAIFTFSDSVPSAKDSTKHSFFRNFNMTFIWFEAGNTFAIKEKSMLSLTNGMDKYFYNVKSGFSGNIFGLGLYFKDEFGIAVIFQAINEFDVSGNDFQNYIAAKYPGYYLPKNVPTYSCIFDQIVYRISYRYHIKKYTIEPIFQLGINDYSTFSNNFVLKEIGSNQFVEYNMESENLKKNNYSYHLALNIFRRFHMSDTRLNWEPGIRLDYMIAPTDYKYTVTETPYLMTPTINTVVVKQMHPSFSIQAFVTIFFKK